MNRNLFFIALVLLTTASCNGNNADVNRAVEVFFLGVLQVMNLATFGVCSIVFSALSNNPKKPALRVLGWVFFGIFTIFLLYGFMAVTDRSPRHMDVYIIFVVGSLMMMTSLILLVRKPKEVETVTESVDYRQVDSTDEVI